MPFHFNIAREDLLHAISSQQHITNKKGTLAILSNVLIEVGNNEIIFTATDLEISLRQTVLAEVFETGTLTLPSKKLFELARESGSATINFKELVIEYKMDFSFTDLRYLTPDEMDINPGDHDKPLDFALGFHAPGCYSKAIDINHCDISVEEMNITLNTVRAFCLQHKDELPIYSTRSHTGELRNLVVRHGGHTGEFMVNLVTSSHNQMLMQQLSIELQSALGDRLTTFVNNITSAKNTVAFGEKEFVLHGPGYITDRLGDYTYRISANSFFQTNTAQAEKLYRQILETAELKPTDVVYDLFCGTGSITLFASSHCKKVLGVELVESSVNDARANAERHNVDNCEFIKLDLKDIKEIRKDMADFGSPDVVITDPPRAGMNPKAVKALLEIAPPAIVYVSCNPASLARDGQMLCEEGQYKLTSCRPIDMFPQTNHVESVARFERI